MKRETLLVRCAFALTLLSSSVAIAQTLSATFDAKNGTHPGNTTVKRPSRVTCIEAVSDTPNPRPPPACYIQANGYAGIVAWHASQSINPGPVTLTCYGQGNNMRCSATVQ
jgi:hypothetical protein